MKKVTLLLILISHCYFTILAQVPPLYHQISQPNTQKPIQGDAIGINIPMVFVHGGSFIMGDGQDLNNPIHQVKVSSFYIGKFDVTQAQWRAIMGNNPSMQQNCDDCPVNNVDWYDVQKFISKLNTKTGKTYRLPTEAEWEYAAKGGNKSNGYTYSGSNDIDEVAWYNKNSGDTTHTVGQKNPNELGLYDMTGNVWQWCQDWYDIDYYKNGRTDNPQGPSIGNPHVKRGGSVIDNPQRCRVTFRNCDTPVAPYFIYVGFRLVLVP